MKTKKISAMVAALTIAATMSIGSLTASATIPELKDPQPASLTVTTDRSAHTYTYYQIFTGTWYEDEDHNIILSDAEWGTNIDTEGLLDYLTTNYADEINDIYIKRAKLVKLVDKEDATIEDVEAAVKAAAEQRAAGTGDKAWEDSEYNIANFSSVEDVLDVFKTLQEAESTRPSANPLVVGFNESPLGKTAPEIPNIYNESSDHNVPVTTGNARMVDIITQFVTGEGNEVKGDYNNEASITVDNGYYLVLEKDNGWDDNGRNAANKTRWATLMKIVDREIKITPKIGTPSLDKKIKENVKDIKAVGANLIGGYSDSDKWNDAGDFSIGDTVEFALFGSVAENINDYKSYYYKFNDRLAKGFVTPEKSDIKVEIGKLDPVAKPADSADNKAASSRTFTGTDVTDKANITITENADGSTAIGIEFKDLKALGVDVDMDTVVRVRYSSVLDDDAIIGEKGNTNGAYLTYSNDVNYNGEGTPETDETSEDGVTAFTYQIDVTKIDGTTNKVLEGAMFTVQAKSGIHEGKYIILNEDGTVKGWSDTASTDNYLTSDANGKINVIGVDDGVYEIVEVKAPKGYNSLNKPVTVTIKATLNDDGTYTYIVDDGSEAYLNFEKGSDADENAATVDKATGKYSTTIANNKGITPPQTGGSGTVALAISGNIMLAAGVIYYASKKKKSNNQ